MCRVRVSARTFLLVSSAREVCQDVTPSVFVAGHGRKRKKNRNGSHIKEWSEGERVNLGRSSHKEGREQQHRIRSHLGGKPRPTFEATNYPETCARQMENRVMISPPNPKACCDSSSDDPIPSAAAVHAELHDRQAHRGEPPQGLLQGVQLLQPEEHRSRKHAIPRRCCSTPACGGKSLTWDPSLRLRCRLWIFSSFIAQEMAFLLHLSGKGRHLLGTCKRADLEVSRFRKL